MQALLQAVVLLASGVPVPSGVSWGCQCYPQLLPLQWGKSLAWLRRPVCQHLPSSHLFVSMCPQASPTPSLCFLCCVLRVDQMTRIILQSLQMRVPVATPWEAGVQGGRVEKQEWAMEETNLWARVLDQVFSGLLWSSQHPQKSFRLCA